MKSNDIMVKGRGQGCRVSNVLGIYINNERGSLISSVRMSRKAKDLIPTQVQFFRDIVAHSHAHLISIAH